METFQDNHNHFKIFVKTTPVFSSTTRPLNYAFVQEISISGAFSDGGTSGGLGLAGGSIGDLNDTGSASNAVNQRVAGYNPQADFYFPVFLTKTHKIHEYVQIDRDDTIYKIERQEINPWYLEFAFFDTIKRNKINKGIDISGQTLFDYIRTLRPEISSLSNADVKSWFDSTGKAELPWGTVTLDELDVFTPNNDSIVSKAKSRKIDINN